MLAAAAVDDRTILGISPWIKPLKFALSLAIYLWTIAWLLGDVRPAAPRAARLVSVGVSLAMVVEIVCIAGQSLRGVPSHFSHATPLDAAVFRLMGLMIALNTLLVTLLLLLYFTCPTGLSRPQLWGARLGMALFLAGSAVGGMMIRNDAHSVGGRDGGPGLPLLNWSTQHGDLRPGHAVLLHALQLLPLLGYAVDRFSGPKEGGKLALVFGFALAYFLLAAVVLGQALRGRPLLIA